MIRRLQELSRRARRELAAYRLALRHPRTPRSARVPLWLALGYLCLPFDLIPDWIPVLGQLDDLVIVPSLIWLALRRIPPDVMDECRRAASQAFAAPFKRTARSGKPCSMCR